MFERGLEAGRLLRGRLVRVRVRVRVRVSSAAACSLTVWSVVSTGIVSIQSHRECSHSKYSRLLLGGMEQLL